MSKILLVASVLNWFLLTVFVVAIAGFVSFANPYGFFLAAVTGVIAFLCFKKNRWGYFAAAAWALAVFQLAKQGYEFQSIKRQVMALGFILVPVAIFLHETLGKSVTKHAEIEDSGDEHDPEMRG